MLPEEVAVAAVRCNTYPTITARMPCCSEKGRLLRDYQTAVSSYSRAVTDLHQRRGVTGKDGYGALYLIAQNARSTAEFAKSDFEGHVSNHCCASC